MAYNKNLDYTAAIAKSKDPIEKAKLEREKAEKVADFAKAGLDYTKPKDVQSFKAEPVATPVASTPKAEPTYGGYKNVEDIYKDVQSGKITSDQQARELGAIWRGENSNISNAQLEQNQRERSEQYYRDNPGYADTLEGQINTGLTNGTIKAIQTANGVQYVDSFGNPIGTLANGTLSKGGTTGAQLGMQQVAQNGAQSLEQQLANAKLAAQKSALEKAFKTSTSSLDAQKPQIQQQTLSAVGQARAQAAQQAKSLKEYLAQRFGQSASGTEAQAMISQQGALQSAEAGANLQEQQAMNELGLRKQQLEQGYASDIASAEAGTEAERLQSTIERIQREQEIARQDKIRQEGIAREDSLLAEEKAIRQQDQERKDFAATIDPTKDLTAQINQLVDSGVPENDFRITELKKARVAKVTNMNQQQYETELANIKSEADKQELALEYAWKMFNAGMPADRQTAALLGVPQGSVIPKQKLEEAKLELDRQKETRIGTKATSNKSASSKSTTEKAEKPNVQFTDYEQALKNQFPDKATSHDKTNTAVRYIAQGIMNGSLPVKEAERLAVRYGVTESMIKDYTNREKFNIMNNL